MIRIGQGKLRIANCELQTANCGELASVRENSSFWFALVLRGDDRLSYDPAKLRAFVQQICHLLVRQQLALDDEAKPKTRLSQLFEDKYSAYERNPPGFLLHIPLRNSGLGMCRIVPIVRRRNVPIACRAKHPLLFPPEPRSPAVYPTIPPDSCAPRPRPRQLAVPQPPSRSQGRTASNLQFAIVNLQFPMRAMSGSDIRSFPAAKRAVPTARRARWCAG